MNDSVTNAMTVDVEDYFHVAALASAIDRADWGSIKPRVERNTERVLELFSEASVHATFFVLGWVAERHPHLVRKIREAGHEIACHGFSHKLIYNQTFEEFSEETHRAKSLLEEISGVEVRGYRAASYSITRQSLWALDVIAETGFDYDSSIVPTKHDLYGIPGAREAPYILELESGQSLREFPPSTVRILNYNLPIGGGGYFRIFPFSFSRWGMRRINRRGERPFAFYLHPWEIDPDQPRVRTNLKSRFRHYHNLHQFEPRLRQLLRDFKFNTMSTVLDSIELQRVALDDLSATPGPAGMRGG